MKEANLNSITQPKFSISKIADLLNVSVQAVHRQIKSKNLTCPKIGNKSYITHTIAKQLFNYNYPRKIISIHIVKGGTGKTTTVQHLGCCASLYGIRVLEIDIDPQANLTAANNVDAENKPVLIDIIQNEAKIQDSIIQIEDGIDMLPSRIENVILDNKLVYEKRPLNTLFPDLLSPIIDKYDLILIDTPPTMGYSVTAANLFADTILAPLNPDKFSVTGLQILENEIEDLKKLFKKEVEYKVFLNKFSSNTVLSDKAIATIVTNPNMQEHVLKTVVKFTQEVPNATDGSKNLFSSLKKSIVREDFDQLTRELLQIDFDNIPTNRKTALSV